MLLVLGVPAIDACRGDSRGLLGCLRGLVNEKFDPESAPVPAKPSFDEPDSALVPAAPLAIDPPADTDPPPAGTVATAEPVVPDEAPVLGEAPAVEDAPVVVAATPDSASVPPVADTPAIPPPAPTRSLSSSPPEKPSAPEIASPPQPKDLPATTELEADEEQVGQSADAASATTSADVTPPEAEPPVAPLVLAELAEPEATSIEPPASSAAIDEAPLFASEPDAASEDDNGATVSPDWISLPKPEMVQPLATPSSDDAAPIDATPDAPTFASQPTDSPSAEAPAPQTVPPAPAEPQASTPTGLEVAAIDPAPPAEIETPTAQTAVLPPSIDAVEIDGEGSFIAGSGPAGATIRLYVDGLPAGVSPVEGGRWLVEGTDLLTETHHTLKVEALDPLSGKVIGDAIAEFERPEVPAPDEDSPPDTAIETSQPDVPSDPLSPAETTAPPASPASQVVEERPVVPDSVETSPPATPIPALEPVAPNGETASVTILRSKDSSSAIVTLSAGGEVSTEAVASLGDDARPPAIIAHFSLPEPTVADDVTVLKAVPIGDPGAGRFVSGKAIIRRGDTLWDIAHRYYGHGIHYRTIFRANREQIARPGKIYPGQVFNLPLVYDD